ncbi:MAG: flavin monoamine oxidase family protein [Solirubrobacteraceae bacterium]
MIDRSSVEDQLDPRLVEEDLDLDVAVVGAGIGGLYAGYRLTTGEYRDGPYAGRRPRVHVFELGDRVGGRLHSVILPGMDIAGELGGMRYLESMKIVTGLIESVFADELEHVDFSMGNPATHFFYLRKQRFRANAWKQAQEQGQRFHTRYHLNDADVGLSAYQLFDKVAYDVLMADPEIRGQYGDKMRPEGHDYAFKLSARDWDAIKPAVRYCFPGPFKGMRVNDLGFWNLLTDRVSEEGLQFLADAGGYYSNTINWNAAEAFLTMVGDFTGMSVEYKTIKGGYDLVAYALAKALLAQRDAKIWKGNGVVDVRPAPTGSARRYQLKIANQATGREWKVNADAVVLAIPRRSLELLDRDPAYLSLYDGAAGRAFRKHVGTVIIQQSMKILMGFERPWWKEDFEATAGESITDLPMRQCYYFGTDSKNKHSLFLSSYNDIDTVSFWRTLESEELFEPRATAIVSQSEVDAIRDLQAPKVMVAESLEQVRELHGAANPIPAPYVTYYKDWSHEPFGGGYHAWDAGVDVAEVMRYMRRPSPREEIHVCGEAYSDQQGWAEGALCEAEKMLQEHFGMQWPTWLDRDYYLGW